MALPEGVSTCVVTYGPAVAINGDPFGNFESVTIRCDRKIIHLATGTPLYPQPVDITPPAGQAISVSVPHVDQAGFIDSAGNSVVSWNYKIIGRLRIGKNDPYFEKTFQVVIGQTDPVDLDLVPDGESVPATTAPMGVVTSINGHTGPVTLAQLVTDLGGSGLATDGDVLAETDRAEGAEVDNQDAITAEILRAGNAEALLAPKASPVLTGTPTAPTQPAGTNNTRLATTAYADAAVTLEAAARAAAIATLTGGAPPELDQFIEAYNRFLADESAAAATNAALATKVPTSRQLAGLDLTADRSAQAIVDALATPLAASLAPLIKGVTSLSSSAAPTQNTTTKYDATAAARTPTLPALSGLPEGATFGVQKGDIGPNTITFTCAGSDTFDSGTATFVLRYADLRYLQVVKIGGTKFWKVVGGNTPQTTVDAQAAAPKASITQHRYNQAGGNEPNAYVCWTGDDGYTAHAAYFSLLASKGVKGTLFLTQLWVDHAGTQATWGDTYITSAQVQALVDAGHEIGEHGYNHEDKPSYYTTNGAAALQALNDGVIAYIQSTFGTTVTTSAYPAGLSTSRTREIQGRSVKYARGTKGAVAYRASDPFDVPGIDFLALSEAQIKAYIDDALANESPVVFLTHGVAPAALDAFLTKVGNCVDYAASLGIRQGTFRQMMDERVAYRGPSGSMVDSLGHAYFRTVKATRVVVQRDDTLFGRAWFDIDEVASNPFFDADGGGAWEFRKAIRTLATAEIGGRRTVYSDMVTYSTTFPRKLTSAAAGFDAADIGRTVAGAGIAGGTTIAAIVSSVEVTLSADTTAAASGVTVTLGRPVGQGMSVAGAANFFGNVNLRSDSGGQYIWQGLGGGALGAIGPAGWSRSGSGGPMLIDSGTGGSTVTVKGFRYQVMSHTGAAKINLCTAAPTDASLLAGEGGIWFDTTAGAVKIKFKVKEADGVTMRNGEVALA